GGLAYFCPESIAVGSLFYKRVWQAQMGGGQRPSPAPASARKKTAPRRRAAVWCPSAITAVDPVSRRPEIERRDLHGKYQPTGHQHQPRHDHEDVLASLHGATRCR